MLESACAWLGQGCIWICLIEMKVCLTIGQTVGLTYNTTLALLPWELSRSWLSHKLTNHHGGLSVSQDFRGGPGPYLTIFSLSSGLTARLREEIPSLHSRQRRHCDLYLYRGGVVGWIIMSCFFSLGQWASRRSFPGPSTFFNFKKKIGKDWIKAVHIRS